MTNTIGIAAGVVVVQIRDEHVEGMCGQRFQAAAMPGSLYANDEKASETERSKQPQYNGADSRSGNVGDAATEYVRDELLERTKQQKDFNLDHPASSAPLARLPRQILA